MLALLACSRTTVTSADVAAAMLDRDAIARPSPDGVAGWTSADPTGGDDDRGHYVRDEVFDGRTEHVLVDHDGPGALVRLWSANPERGGTLRIRADGELVLEEDFAALLGGRGSVPEPLAATRGRGGVLILPIPFADRLLVTIDRSTGKGLYYGAQVRTFPRRTRVVADPIALDALADGLRDRSVEGEVARVEGPAPQTVRLSGPGAVRALRFDVPPDALDALRVTVDTDGRRTVDVPLGGLAGLGPVAAEVDTWWVSATPAGAIEVRWPIPYTAELVVTLAGDAVPVALAAVHGAPIAGAMTFHAAHRDETVRTRPRPEVVFAALGGPGVYVGDTLRVDNPVPGWWGMGDERVRVDGALAWTGTGTEDWYGAAWCSHATFSSLLAAQAWTEAADTEDACASAQGGAVYTRGRILDALPFRDALDLRFEVAHREDTALRLRSTTLWYAASSADP